MATHRTRKCLVAAAGGFADKLLRSLCIQGFYHFVTFCAVEIQVPNLNYKENYKEKALSHGVVYHVPVSAGYKGCHPLFQGTCGNRAWLSVNPTRVGIWCLLSEKGNL